MGLHVMNVEFIPNFILEWNLNPNLHDSESIFHSGSGVRAKLEME